jgi:hypothetical protein
MTRYQADKTQRHLPTLDISPRRSRLSKSPRLAAAEVQNHAEILNLIKKHVANEYPKAMDDLLQAESYDDKRDQLLRAFANTWQQILKYLNRVDTLKLWAKMHALFQLKLDSDTVARRMIEPLSVTDLQEELFKVDTFFTKEHAALEYALNKLEEQRLETK